MTSSPSSKPEKKTDWVYGSVARTILEFAKRKARPFCVTELYPIFEPMMAALNCRHLYESGRLACEQKGEIGRGRKRAFYKFPSKSSKIIVRCANTPEVDAKVKSNLAKLRL